jgi:NitT/TauT family transport system permease protein
MSQMSEAPRVNPAILKRRRQLRAAPWLFAVIFFLLWEGGCRAFGVSTFVLPTPTVIIGALWEYRVQLLTHALHTSWMTTLGFALSIAFGLFLGLLVGSSRYLYVGLNPILVGFNSIPKVAVVPVLVIWFGVGWLPPVLTAFVISFFPLVVNVATGLATIEPETEDVMKALGASRLDIITKVGLPRSMPYFFGALKVAITLAYVGSVVGGAERFQVRPGQPDHARCGGFQRAADLRRAHRAGRARHHPRGGGGGGGEPHHRLGKKVGLRRQLSFTPARAARLRAGACRRGPAPA